jgi:superoxide dismutase, Cu-Zn family
MNYVALIISITAIVWWQTPTIAAQGPIDVVLKNATGETVGNAQISPLAKGVRIVVDVRGLSPGEHAIHFHEKGSCVAPKFESAGGHFAPAKNAHGFDSKDGHHAGDMPNLRVPDGGSLKIEIVNTAVTLSKGANSLMKKDGTALVIHAAADDYKSQPAGNAGDRQVCGEIKGL